MQNIKSEIQSMQEYFFGNIKISQPACLFMQLLLCFYSGFYSSSAAFSPAMENHISSPINSGTLEYKSGLTPISPGSYSPLPRHLLGEEDINRLDGFSFLR